MRFYWFTDCIKQGYFQIYWMPLKVNLTDYHANFFTFPPCSNNPNLPIPGRENLEQHANQLL